ncbi:MAG: hypothetical protein IPG07_22080 [Crocinitomicaceae bacterium]|nr:hypothetical protein [Crocinitomicaceae bacterium]
MVFSGVVGGQSDLYLLDLNSQSRKQLTDDIYDDVDPVFIDNSSRILFASNRSSDTIFKKPEINFVDHKNDIFIYDLKHMDHTYKFLEQITQTPDDNETKPFAIEKNTYIFLSDKKRYHKQIYLTKR